MSVTKLPVPKTVQGLHVIEGPTWAKSWAAIQYETDQGQVYEVAVPIAEALKLLEWLQEVEAAIRENPR